MIEVKERLNVNQNKFFNKISESVCYDIEKATGKKINPGSLYKGYKYKKIMKNKMGRKGKVEIIITDFKYPVAYGAKFKSINGINKINYKIHKINDDTIEVTYTEDFSGNTNSININFKFVSFFYKRKAKKRAKKMLKDIELYLLQNND